MCDCRHCQCYTYHSHCWHDHHGILWMVVPDGHIVQKCCGCLATRTIHVDHAWGGGPRPRPLVLHGHVEGSGRLVPRA